MNKVANIALNNGVEMPLIGLGTYLLKPPEVFKVTEAALKLGYGLIDTASVYKNESSIGEVLKKIDRKDVFVTSKLGPANQGSEKSVSSALTSLKDLQLDYLDLYLIHWPGTSGIKPDDPKNSELRKESWLALEKMYKEGKFKSIGISNYSKQHIEELLQYCTVVPAVLQIEVHPYLTQKEIRKFCAEKGIHVQAYSSLGSRHGCKDLMSDPTVVEIAHNHNKTCAQVLLRWAIENGMSVIPKTQNIDRLKENLDIFDFSLTQEEIEKLDSLDKQVRYCWDPKQVK